MPGLDDLSFIESLESVASQQVGLRYPTGTDRYGMPLYDPAGWVPFESWTDPLPDPVPANYWPELPTGTGLTQEPGLLWYKCAAMRVTESVRDAARVWRQARYTVYIFEQGLAADAGGFSQLTFTDTGMAKGLVEPDNPLSVQVLLERTDSARYPVMEWESYRSPQTGRQLAVRIEV